MVKVLPRGRLELCQTALQVTRVLGEPSRIPWSITGGSVLDYDGKCKPIAAGDQVAVHTFSIFETTYFAFCSYKIQSPRRRVESVPIN